MNSKIKRKIKLLKLNNDELGAILERILEQSKIANTEDILTAKLSNTEDILTAKLSKEIAESIDKEIIKNLNDSYLLKK